MQLLLFQVGDRPFGIELPRVESIQSVKHNVDERIVGSEPSIWAFDDKQSSLYDLVSIFENKNASRDLENEKLIMVKAEEQSIGIIVNRVDQVVSVDNDRIEPLSPIFKGASMSCFPNVLKHEDTLILILAPQGIEQAVQERANPPNLTNIADCGEAFPDAEDIVLLVNEVATDSDHDPMSPVGQRNQDSDIYEALQTENKPERKLLSQDLEIADMSPEIMGIVDIDDASQYESTSFLNNLLQDHSDDSSQAKPAGSK